MKVRQDLIYREKASFQVSKSMAHITNRLYLIGSVLVYLLCIVVEFVPKNRRKLIRCNFS